MRVRLPLGRGLFFLCAFLFALVALLPLRLAAEWLRLDTAGVAARGAVGSIWGGMFQDTQVRELRLGDLRAELKALPLLLGRARVQLGRGDDLLDRAEPRADRFSGALTVSRNSYGADDVTARLPLGPELSPLPITAIDLSDVSARFVRGQCATAEGPVTIETAGSITGLPIPATMTGNARCEGGALLLPLAGAGGLEQLSIRLSGTGAYRATLTVRPADPQLGQRLAAAGFTAAGGAYSLNLSGRID